MHYYSQVILTDGSWHCKPAHISDSDREDSHGNPEARDSPVGCHLSNHYLFKANKNGCFILLFSCLPCLPLYTQVNNKRRSPPSERPPFGAHLSTHHSISPDEQDSPERIVSTTNVIFDPSHVEIWISDLLQSYFQICFLGSEGKTPCRTKTSFESEEKPA